MKDTVAITVRGVSKVFSQATEYEATIRRLLQLPINVVHAGHEPSFNRTRLHELITEQFHTWGVAAGK